jgi:Protein of unknown function (DUF559)
LARDVDRRIAALARQQHGYVTRQQLLGVGLGSEAIKHRIATARLLRVHNGVYAVGHEPTLAHDRAFAAILACGAGALLSHATAASVWGIYKHWTTPFHVSVTGSPRRREGIHVHRARLDPSDRDNQHGLPVTSPARTLVDNAPDLTDKALTRAVNDLRLRHLLVLDDLAATIARCSGYPGVPRLRSFVENPTGPTRSEFEDAFKAFCERFGLPQPLINEPLAGFEVDAYFPVERVIVELDSEEFHGHTFESDRDRDATLLALGFVTVRITWERLKSRPEREAARLLAILEQRLGSYPPLTDL